MAGRILEDRLFPYPCLRNKDREAAQPADSIQDLRDDCRILTIFEGTCEVLRLYIALSGLKELGRSFADLKAALLREAADIYERYTVKFAKAADYLLRKHGKSIAGRRAFAQQAKRRMAGSVRRITRNEDEAMDRLAGFVVDKGSYPWDVVS
jgi:hypothetical protein